MTGSSNAGEHFFISVTVDVIVVSILLAIVGRKQRRLVEAHERLAHSEKVATLGQVAAQVAHEVRNPLAGLLLYSEHLKSKVSGTLPEGEAQIVDKIIDTVNHLTSTTEQILNFARPLKLTPQRVDLNAVARDVIELLRTEIAANASRRSWNFIILRYWGCSTKHRFMRPHSTWYSTLFSPCLAVAA